MFIKIRKLNYYFYKMALGNSARTTKTKLIMGLFNITLVASDGSANASTVQLNSQYVQALGVPTASEIVNYPTAATAITYIVYEQNTPKTRRYLTASTPSAVTALSNASNSAIGTGLSGDATLVAGTVNVAIPGLTSSSKVVLTRHTAGGTVTSTVEYFYVVSANQLTITAAVAAGTINVADTSVITYAIVG